VEHAPPPRPNPAGDSNPARDQSTARVDRRL